MTIRYLCTILLAWSTTCATASSDQQSNASNGQQLRGSSTPPRRLAYSGQVTALELINAISTNDIGTAVRLVDGAEISLASFGLTQPNFSINAIAGGDAIGSVVFRLNNGEIQRSETTPLYALCGNSGDDFTTCPQLDLRSHTITATAYSGAGGTGEMGGSLTINFTIVPGPPTSLPPPTTTTPPLPSPTSSPPPPTPPTSSPPTPPTSSPPTVGPVEFAKRINIAGKAYTDTNGNVWEADTVKDGKNALIVCDGTTDIIGQTVNDPLYCSYKWYAASNSAVPFRREIPVDQEGIYQVRLHFAELVSAVLLFCCGCGPVLWTMLNLSFCSLVEMIVLTSPTLDSFDQRFTSAKKRIFDVKVEDVTVASKLDVFASAGGNKKAYIIELNNTDCRDGKVTIEFGKSVSDPILSGVEVIRYGQPMKTCGIPKVRTHFRSFTCFGRGGGFGWKNFGLNFFGLLFLFACLVSRYKVEEHARHFFGISASSGRGSRRNDWARLCHCQWLL